MSLIVIDRNGWSWHGPETPASQTEIIALAKRKRVVVALSSDLCFSGVVDASGSAKEMLYRLEEVLPVDAETLVADFVVTGSKACAVAVPRELLQSILNALSESTVVAICPLALLATAESQTSVVRHGQDEVHLSEGRPTQWHWGLAGNSEQHSEQLQRAAAFAEKILAGQGRPPIDLRERSSSGLATRTGLLAVAAMIVVSILSATMWLRTWRYDAALSAMEADERAAYASVLPGDPPADIVARLDSVARRLEGSGGAELPPRTPGSAVMVALLGALPPSLKIDLSELRWESSIDTASFYLVGRAASHRDAEAIAAALRTATTAGGPLQVGSPATEQLPDGSVTFSISGTRKRSAQPAQRGDAQ